MIMDYFDESLVLMKRMLCWEIDDILYMKLNERRDTDKGPPLSKIVKENIRRWNKADVSLFNHFNATFRRKVKMEGAGFEKDLFAFRRRKLEIEQMCFNRTRLQLVYGTKFVKGYSIKKRSGSKCKRFLRKSREDGK